MKRILEKIFLVISSNFLTLLVCKRKSLLILDLDNTLVQTREYQIMVDTFDVYGSSNFPDVSAQVKNYVASRMEHPRDIYVLSARPYKYWRKSRRYCSEQFGVKRVILTRTAENKLFFLKKLNSLGAKITYIDDLSYGLEQVELYEELIAEVKSLKNIVYKDLKWIQTNLL